MSTFLKTLLQGALALAALYITGKIAYEAGKDIAREEGDYAHRVNEGEPMDAECDSADDDNSDEETGSGLDGNEAEADCGNKADEAQNNNPCDGIIKRKFAKVALALGLKKLTTHKKDSIIGDMMRHPERHKIEAFVEGGGLRINIRKRRTVQRDGA